MLAVPGHGPTFEEPDVTQDMLPFCLVCLTPFTRRQPAQTACSNRCYMFNQRHPGKVDATRKCLNCQSKLPKGKHRAAKYCSPRCTGAASKRRRKVVSSEYVRNEACFHCGAILEGVKAGRQYCSDQCWRREHFGYSHEALASRKCGHCGTALPTDARVNKRNCSDRCTVLSNQVVRRARRKNLPAEHFSRFAVFERDDWTCHICQAAVNPSLSWPDPRSATLDHLIALNDPDSPGHVWVNVACAHARCNLSKNDRTRTEDRELHQRLVEAATRDQLAEVN